MKGATSLAPSLGSTSYLKSRMIFAAELVKGRAMAKDMYEVRWHARGGQGAKTAAALVAEVALAEGKYSQGFPEY